MSESPDGEPDAARKRVLAAAFDEVTRWGIERFSVENLAARHGIDQAVIDTYWSDEEALLLEVLVEWPGRSYVSPDTGSLAGDLTAMAMAMAEYISSEPGRKIQGALVIPDRSGLRVAVRQKVWLLRSAVVQDIFARAMARGEMRQDVDTRTVLQMLLAPINMRVLLTREPVDEHYCRTVVELMCRAVAP
ncbi:TetR-like C-terminal domain-containing protein [Mycobacterium sp. MAA66]|uniref:TetR-like C-terminal domain-containing protein n=1 Tax=Mycobacterium sp. MAA66 TaxID=3156297 RepID=UPI003516DDE3